LDLIIINSGDVIWITGLSGSGKTTTATIVVNELRELGHPTIFLDGDILREIFGSVEESKKNHGREARINLALKYSHLCSILANQGVTVVIATISMFKEVHSWNRKNLPNYFEVYLKVPLHILEKRDPKGIYLRQREGLITDVAGIDLTVDEPTSPGLIVEYKAQQSADQVSRFIISGFLETKKV